MRPDSNLEADVLAAVLHDPERYAHIMFRLLDSQDFATPSAQAVFNAISSVAKRDGNEAIAPATIRDELRRRNLDERDVLNLLDPDLGLGPVGSFEPKCRRLREIRQQRYFEEGMSALMQKEWTDPQELMDQTRLLQEQTQAMTPVEGKNFADLVDDMVSELEHDLQHDDHRIKTGLPTLDKYLHGGFTGGWLTVVGARTGVGKTTFAIQVASKAAAAGQRVLYFTMEEGPTLITERIVRFHKRIERSFRKSDIDPLIKASFEEDVRELPVSIHQDSRLESIVGYIAEQVIEREGVGLVVVDYAGLVQAPGHYDSKVQEIGEVTKALKLTAMHHKVPIMLLAQVNRSPMSRNDRRPLLSDLRDSGALEQDADIVIFLHHDEQEPSDDIVRLAKNRYGPPGDLPARYDYPYGRVEELVQT